MEWWFWSGETVECLETASFIADKDVDCVTEGSILQVGVWIQWRSLEEKVIKKLANISSYCCLDLDITSSWK